MEIQKLKQTVYLPVKVENDCSFLITKEISDYLWGNCSIDFYKDGKCIYSPSFITQTSRESDELEHLIIARLDKKELFVFTPEQLNEYTQSVIKQALETAAKNAQCCEDAVVDLGHTIVEAHVDEKSITDTFEETFKKFEV